MSATPVTRQTLREQVVRIVRDEILTGALEQGERLSEPGLAKRLDVSLTPVREALSDLAASGLVVRNGRHGTFVRQIGVQDARNLLAVRKSLETLAVTQAVPRLSPTDDAIIRRLVSEQTSATELAQSDPDAATPLLGELNERFHYLVLERSGNEWLESMLTSIQDLLLFVRTELRRRASVARRRESLAEHRRIAEALLARDSDAAAVAMAEHVDRLEQGVVALLTEHESASSGGLGERRRATSLETVALVKDDQRGR